MAARILKGLAWVATGIAALAVAAYLTLVAINWRDREPSAAALRMEAVYRDRPTVADADNGYVFTMGFNVPPGDSPRAMGLKRLAWLQSRTPGSPWDLSQDPLGGPRERSTRPPLVQGFLQACALDSENCPAAFDASEAVFQHWMASEGWLLARYRQLIAHAGWRESVMDASAPLPAFALVMDGQKLLLLHARDLAREGRSSQLEELLGQDLRFWRRVLESSDTLLSRMIAKRAIERQFKWGNRVLRALPAGRELSAVPEEWRAPMSSRERSMLRCMVGEWVFSSAILRDPFAYADRADEEPILEKVQRILGRAFYQPQDSINGYAQLYTRIVQLTDVPLEQYPAAVRRVTALAEPESHDFSAYNLMGRALLGSKPDFGGYVARTGDIEGVRRAALAAVSLRDTRTPLGGVAAALAISPLRNPYDGQAFGWDEKRSEIVFRGLEAGERGEHRVGY